MKLHKYQICTRFHELECQRIERLNEVLAGVELTEEEEKTLLWITGWEDQVTEHLISIIKKVIAVQENEQEDYKYELERGANYENKM